MRIAIIYRDFDSNVGDAYDVQRIALNLANFNTNVDIYCSDNCKNALKHPNIKYFRRKYSFLSIVDLFFHRKRVDIAHLFCGYIASLYWISIILRLTNIPYCYSGFGQLSEEGLERSFWKKKLYTIFCLKPMLKNAKFIQISSDHERNYLLKIGAKKTVTAPLSIEGYELKAKESISKQKLVTFIGRFDIWQKGLDLFIEVINETSSSIRQSGHKVVVAGRGDKLSIEYLKLKIREYQLDDIISIKIDISDEEKIQLLSSTNIFYHPSRVEGFARSMREALSMKIPILTTPGSNIGDTLNKYKAGISTEFEVKQQAKALIKLLNSDDLNTDWDGLFKYLSWRNTSSILSLEYQRNCKIKY